MSLKSKLIRRQNKLLRKTQARVSQAQLDLQLLRDALRCHNMPIERLASYCKQLVKLDLQRAYDEEKAAKDASFGLHFDD